jgi:hypothetical protein
MGGGLLQLVAYGAQDAYLSGNPQITFWRGLFKRHTNFAMEPFRVNMTGQASWGTKHSAILTRYADLVSSGYIEVELQAEESPIALTYTNGRKAGFNMVQYVELDIGGQIIDRQYGEYMYLWSTIAYDADARTKMDSMGYASLTNNAQCSSTGRPTRPNLTYIPLMFFFCRNPGAALPLIALQYHEVKINVLWNDVKLVYGTTATGASISTGPAQANLVMDYIYLDVEERRRMAQESHEYLIEQTQYNEDKGLTSAQNRVDLTFNHPVKELLWVTQASYRKDCRFAAALSTTISPLDYDAIIYDCALQLNGQDRMQALPGKYFRDVQTFQHHTGLNLDGLYIYSFAIKPEEHQPSGTCNFSRIDSATLVFSVDGSYSINNADANNYDIRVYAINYNILRVMSGMGGLAYSN